jgi:hypothetical protein
MNFLHYDVTVDRNDVIEVALDKQANVRLVDGANFEKYKKGEHYIYYGGRAKASPVHLRAPSAGHWHLVVDLGGFPGTVKVSVRIIKDTAE